MRTDDIHRLRELWRTTRTKSRRCAICGLLATVFLAIAGGGLLYTGAGYILVGLLVLALAIGFAIFAIESWDDARLATRDLKATEGRTGL